MERKTFNNLPDDKKQMIIDIAVDEFAEHGYKKASINSIVKRAGIAKGSIYQYFANKEDLYQYIVELAISKKLEYMKGLSANLASGHFFDQIRELCILDIRFSRDNPQLEKLFVKVLLSEDLLRKEDLIKQVRFASEDFLKGLILNSMQNGEFRDGLDVDLVVFCINSLFLNLSQKIIQDYSGDVSDQEIITLADQLIDILKNGLAN